MKWHQRFRHSNFTSILELVNKEIVRDIKVNIHKYELCCVHDRQDQPVTVHICKIGIQFIYRFQISYVEFILILLWQRRATSMSCHFIFNVCVLLGIAPARLKVRTSKIHITTLFVALRGKFCTPCSWTTAWQSAIAARMLRTTKIIPQHQESHMVIAVRMMCIPKITTQYHEFHWRKWVKRTLRPTFTP